MEIATWRGLRHFARLMLCGIVAAFAVALLSLLLGSSTAHASDDDGDRPGLLGAVTNVLGGTADIVDNTVTEVTSIATNTVEKVVAVAPAPVQQPVAVVSETVTTVTEPVRAITSSGVVSAVTEPVVAAVTAVPVVGDVVTGLGADHLVTQVGATVDTTLGSVTGAIDDVSESIGTPALPSPSDPILPLPALPILPPSHGIDAAASDAVIPAVVATSLAATPASAEESWNVTTASPSLLTLSQATPTTASTTAQPAERSGSAPPLGGPCAAVTSSLGSGGAGAGSWALAALLPVVAHRAWVRRAGPKDDDAPPPPASSTDVSPD